jgi:hypothetical protein
MATELEIKTEVTPDIINLLNLCLVSYQSDNLFIPIIEPIDSFVDDHEQVIPPNGLIDHNAINDQLIALLNSELQAQSVVSSVNTSAQSVVSSVNTSAQSVVSSVNTQLAEVELLPNPVKASELDSARLTPTNISGVKLLPNSNEKQLRERSKRFTISATYDIPTIRVDRIDLATQVTKSYDNIISAAEALNLSPESIFEAILWDYIYAGSKWRSEKITTIFTFKSIIQLKDGVEVAQFANALDASHRAKVDYLQILSSLRDGKSIDGFTFRVKQ